MVALKPVTSPNRKKTTPMPTARNAASLMIDSTATGLLGAIDPVDVGDGDPTEAWLGQIMGLLSPMLLGMTTGSLVGHLATRNFGLFDLPIPRPPSDDVLILAANVEAFASDWSMRSCFDSPNALRP